MSARLPFLARRHFVGGVAAASLAAWYTPGAMAEELTRTPAQTEGPFYPDHLPLDTDNDLLIVNDNLSPAVGEITHLTGRILDAHGNPIRNAAVEIWQVDNHGIYLHSQGGDRATLGTLAKGTPVIVESWVAGQEVLHDQPGWARLGEGVYVYGALLRKARIDKATKPQPRDR